MRFPDSLRWFLSANPLPKGAAHACSGFASRGGVSHRDARRLRGRSTIEYVLLIAIVALVAVLAGSAVAGAIRNSFNRVTGTLALGISKGGWEADGGGADRLSDCDIADPINGTAFAVYSTDDDSLVFYKRRGTPPVGARFMGRTVTEVYTGIESAWYSATWDEAHSSHNNGPTNCPWYARHDRVRSVLVADAGIRPRSMAFWFQLFTSLEKVDLDRLDVSAVTSWQHAFWHCTSISDLDLSGVAVTRLANMDSMCTGCTSLRSLSLHGWTGSPESVRILAGGCPELTLVDLGAIDLSHTNDFLSMFEGCSSLVLDCSGWDVPARPAYKTNFNLNAPGVTPPGAWS